MIKVKDLKVKDFTGDIIVTKFAGEDLYKVQNKVNAEVITNEGTLHYTIKPGFPTNMRSGSNAINWFIPKFTGNNKYNLAILCHDFAYTKLPNGNNPLSKEVADELLRQMVIMSGQLGSIKAAVMYQFVDKLGGSAYYSENTGDYADAGEYMAFEWGHK